MLWLPLVEASTDGETDDEGDSESEMLGESVVDALPLPLDSSDGVELDDGDDDEEIENDAEADTLEEGVSDWLGLEESEKLEDSVVDALTLPLDCTDGETLEETDSVEETETVAEAESLEESVGDQLGLKETEPLKVSVVEVLMLPLDCTDGVTPEEADREEEMESDAKIETLDESVGDRLRLAEYEPLEEVVVDA